MKKFLFILFSVSIAFLVFFQITNWNQNRDIITAFARIEVKRKIADSFLLKENDLPKMIKYCWEEDEFEKKGYLRKLKENEYELSGWFEYEDKSKKRLKKEFCYRFYLIDMTEGGPVFKDVKFDIF